MNKTIKTADVTYREDLYPRSASSPELVQTYAENLDVLPPIEINQNNILIDGWHRWTAHGVEVSYRFAFPDVCPVSLAGLPAGEIKDGTFCPHGSVARHFAELQKRVTKKWWTGKDRTCSQHQKAAISACSGEG